MNQRFDSGLLCKHCHHSIAWLPKPFNVDIAAGTILPIQAATYYDYPIRQAIRAFKYHENMTKLPLLLHTLRQLPRPHGCHKNNSVIVAMPTTAATIWLSVALTPFLFWRPNCLNIGKYHYGKVYGVSTIRSVSKGNTG